MKLTPTLKNILIRSGCIVGTCGAYIALVKMLHAFSDYHTLCGIAHFAASLLLIWLNLRPLTKPIRQLFIALFILVYTSILFWHKTVFWSWNSFQFERFLLTFGFVMLASLLPIFLQHVQAPRLATCGKVALWAAVLWLDFAAAFPNIAFSDRDSEGAYMGVVRVDNPDKPYKRALRTFAFAHQKWGLNDVERIDVLTPIDPKGIMYERRNYTRNLDCDYMVDTLTCDTIWLCERGVWFLSPDRKTMENLELISLRHTWQYDMWHRLKRMFNKNK